MDEQKSEPDKLEDEIDQYMDGRKEDNANEPASAPELNTETASVNDGSASNASEAASESENPASNLDDDQTEQAIDEINKDDSDKLLAVDDTKSSTASGSPEKPNLFKRWWSSRKWRYGTLVFILALIVAAFVLPVSRYFILNHVGQRGQVSVTVLDGSTKLPLKNASVSLDGQQKTSGKNGEVSFASVKLGKETLTIKKPAFASVTKVLTVNIGKTNLGKLALKAVGIQFTIKLTDYLTGQPVAGAEVSAGTASALSDANGKAVLTTMDASVKALKVTITASGYVAKTTSIVSANHSASAALVPTGQDYFVSNKSGDYNLYSSNLDGSDSKVLLAATGSENSNLQLATDDDGGLLALVDTRDTQRGAKGEVLQTLTLVNTKNRQPLNLDHATQVQVIGWMDGGTLVYVTANDCSTGLCYQLMSYNYSTSSRIELAHASGFSSVLTIGDKIYYATSSNYQSSDTQPVFASVNSDGTGQQTLLKDNVYSVYRPSYDELLLAAPGNWYSYQDGDKAPKKIAAPSNPELRHYVDSPGGSQAAWIDQRDGQPVLVIYNKSTGKNKVVATLAGLTYPIRWLNNSTLIFRVNSSSETADYALSLSGGQPEKITNVTNAGGSDDFGY